MGEYAISRAGIMYFEGDLLPPPLSVFHSFGFSRARPCPGKIPLTGMGNRHNSDTMYFAGAVFQGPHLQHGHLALELFHRRSYASRGASLPAKIQTPNVEIFSHSRHKTS